MFYMYLFCLNLHFGFVELHLVQLLPVASHFTLQLVRLDGSLSQGIQFITVSAGCACIQKQLGILVKLREKNVLEQKSLKLDTAFYSQKFPP